MSTDKKKQIITNVRGFTLIELSFVIGIFLLMTVLLAPFIHIARQKACKVNCANNLMRISLALHAYAADHNGSFPQSLGELFPKYVQDDKIFDCPATKNIGTMEKPDYKYTAGLKKASGPKEIIAEDADDHKGSLANVLRVNGDIDWIRRR